MWPREIPMHMTWTWILTFNILWCTLHTSSHSTSQHTLLCLTLHFTADSAFHCISLHFTLISLQFLSHFIAFGTSHYILLHVCLGNRFYTTSNGKPNLKNDLHCNISDIFSKPTLSCSPCFPPSNESNFSSITNTEISLFENIFYSAAGPH